MPFVAGLAIVFSFVVDARVVREMMDDDMLKAATEEAKKLDTKEWEKKKLAGLTDQEKKELEKLKESLEKTAKDLENSAGKESREVLADLEKRARKAEKLAEKLGSDEDNWASAKLVEELRKHADTADLGDAVAEKKASDAAKTAETLAGQLKSPQLTNEVRERMNGTLKPGQKQADKEDRKRAGAQNALFSALQVLVGAGDEVITPDPRYSTYEAVVGATGATLVSVPLVPERGFHLDLQALAAAITPRTRVILLNSPHNPTGAAMSRADVEAVAALAQRHDLWLVSDEVYAALSFESEHVSPASLPGMAERTVVVSSLSKSHAMTGWRVGWAIGPLELARHLHNLFLCMLYGSPGFVQDAAIVAIEQASNEVETMRETYRRRRDLVAPWLDRLPGLGCRLPEGGMFCMADCRGSGLSSQDFAIRLLEEESVAILPGDGFGRQAEGFLRISLGLPDATLAEACRRIEAFCGRLAAPGLSAAEARRARG